MSDAALRELAGRIEQHLGEALGRAVRVRAIAPLVGGACQDNLRVELEPTGELPPVLVLRSDAPGSLPGSLGRRQELEVVRAAVAGGVRAPAARWPAEGLVRAGAAAYFLDWREGVALGRKVVSDPALADARAQLGEALAGELARIHAITPATHPALEAALGPGDRDPAASALAFAERMLDGLDPPRPALELTLRWLREHAPARGEVTLVHGDLRTGNYLVAPEGLTAVLDWEFAHWGAPAEDLAWLCTRDWRFGRHDRPVGGVAARAPFYAAYERASGRALDRRELHFWEVFCNLRWAAGCAYQGRRWSAAAPDLELLAIARRAAEMEFEALRLIERREGGGWPADEPIAPAEAAEEPEGASEGPALLEAVARFLASDVRPHVADKGVAFRLRVAESLLAGTARELRRGPGAARAVLERTFAVARELDPSLERPDLGEAPEPGAVDRAQRALDRELCRALRRGSVTPAQQTRARAVLLARLRAELTARDPAFDVRLELEPEDPWTSLSRPS